MDWKSLSSKKIAGIPVLYLVAAAVVIFAVWAWQMKSSGDEPTGDENTTGESVPESEDDSAAADYSGLTTSGTVTVVQPATEETESVKQTNDDWFRAAVAYLIEEKKATAGEAQTAINNYLEGNDMSYEQGALRDAAVVKLGLPPERIATLGNVASKADPPFQRQFSNFPGKHTVKGKNDHQPWQLAAYYGNPNWDNANLIAAANPKLGPPNTIYPVGTVVNIPAWVSPSWATTTSSMRHFKTVAAKNGTTVDALRMLNPNKQEPFAVGIKVRIR
jgi:hypothetical protein